MKNLWSAMSVKQTLQFIGDQYLHFRLDKKTPLEDLCSTMLELTHVPSGAQVIHIACDDPENLFCLSFRTYPTSSCGVAHILEHTTLCGSKKFPVKDPFFGMSRRSLNTFMNAFTGSDFTCYPAASQVPKDFYNLLEVYLDAVFCPELKQMSFLQEGHRLEFHPPHDPLSPLVYKGVVYNEMKGALSSPESRMWKKLMQALFPDVFYRFDSGGDPADIPSLSYEALKNFHTKHYHPSQCLYFFYGNLPLEGHLKFLHEHALKDAQKTPPLPTIPLQPRFEKLKTLYSAYPISKKEYAQNKHIAAIGWLTCHILNQLDSLTLLILESALMGTDAAPLKKALLESQLCMQASIYIDSEIHEVPVALVFHGCKAGAAEKLYRLTIDTLKKIACEGLPPKVIESALHQMQLSRSDIGSSQGPFGLNLFMQSGLHKQHGGSPCNALRTHELFETLRKRLNDSSFLAQFLTTYFIQNDHCAIIELQPDFELALKEENAEKRTLEALQAKLDENAKQQIIKQTQALKEFQKQQDGANLDVLPKISLKDVAKEPPLFTLHDYDINGVKLYHCPCFTNNVLYTDLYLKLPHIGEEDLSWVRFFSVVLPEMGTKALAWQEHLEFMQLHTGGVACGTTLHKNVQKEGIFQPLLYLKSKALARNTDALFQLLSQILQGADFSDRKRLREILLQHHNALENSLLQQPLKYAMTLSAKGLSSIGKMQELWQGLEYVSFIRRLVNLSDQEIADALLRIQDMVLKGPLDLIVSCDAKFLPGIQKALRQLPWPAHTERKSWKERKYAQALPPQGRISNTSVSFTALVFPTVDYTHAHAPALTIASALLENKVLHSRIREMGGAYGSGAAFNATLGQFSFYSYRDPNIAATLQAFDDSLQEIARGRFDEKDVEEAKLSILQDTDAPIPPSNRGLSAYIWQRTGKDFALRRQWRNALLSCSCAQIKEAVSQHLLDQTKKGCPVTFASQELLRQENTHLLALGREEMVIGNMMDET